MVGSSVALSYPVFKSDATRLDGLEAQAISATTGTGTKPAHRLSFCRRTI